MGLWLNDNQIQKIVTRLDFKFSDSGANSGIRKIRGTPTRRNRFNPGGLELHKIARRMRIWGSSGPATRHSKRWWGFLKALHTKRNNAPGGSTDAAEDIKRYIKAALDGEPSCVAIKFAAVTGTDLRVTSNAIPLPEDVTKYITLIILQTPETDGTMEDDPGDIGEDPPGEDTSSVAAASKPTLAKSRTGKARKGSAKKAVRKKKLF